MELKTKVAELEREREEYNILFPDFKTSPERIKEIYKKAVNE